jgi:hypothetical protein
LSLGADNQGSVFPLNFYGICAHVLGGYNSILTKRVIIQGFAEAASFPGFSGVIRFYQGGQQAGR